jgi:hypothetical protein
MPDPDKRQLRKLKRVVKKAGSKHRRRELKQQLVDNPDEAAHAEEHFGKSSSVSLNGLDSDATRKRDKEPE